ncbi:MAG: YxeA family protein [Lachnospiraceae bacterium]|nr:YxeA family protein [Lachnospiraceae bacterium]
MKGKLFAAIITVLILGVCFAGGLYYMENYDEFFYGKVDNSRMEKLSSNDEMKYEYTLDCYNKKGKKRELVFKTSRKLKEGAYISLEVKFSGVHKWEEVQYKELPQKVQDKIE